MLVRNAELRRLFEVILYLGLITGGLLSVRETIDEYNRKSSSYTETQEPTTLSDIPTLTMCWKWDYRDNGTYVYGKDFSINISVNEGKIVTLWENKDSPVFHGLGMHLSRIYRYSYHSFMRKHSPCYKITPKAAGNGKFGGVVVIGIDFDPPNGSVKPNISELRVLLASEANTYAVTPCPADHDIVGFEGEIGPDPGKSKTSDGPFLHPEFNSLEITRVEEYVNLPSTCSQDSYYECLAKRFVQFDVRQAEGKRFEKCTNIDKICLPFSLPIMNTNISLCNLDDFETYDCNKEIFDYLAEDQEEHCIKACQVKTFQYANNGGLLRGNVLSESDWYLEYYFEPMGKGAALRRQNQRSREPFKTVRREYWLMSTMSMVGNVGGTLGMFVGFSFIGTSEWTIDITSKFWTWLRAKQNTKKLHRKSI